MLKRTKQAVAQRKEAGAVKDVKEESTEEEDVKKIRREDVGKPQEAGRRTVSIF